jgi:hypothetical protein
MFIQNAVKIPEHPLRELHPLRRVALHLDVNQDPVLLPLPVEHLYQLVSKTGIRFIIIQR